MSQKGGAVRLQDGSWTLRGEEGNNKVCETGGGGPVLN